MRLTAHIVLLFAFPFLLTVVLAQDASTGAIRGTVHDPTQARVVGAGVVVTNLNPFTFAPQIAGLQLTPLRAYAHDLPKYYMQGFGSALTYPDTNEYAAFLQDTLRAGNHLAFTLGVRV
jgi:hypothetical protein